MAGQDVQRELGETDRGGTAVEAFARDFGRARDAAYHIRDANRLIRRHQVADQVNHGGERAGLGRVVDAAGAKAERAGPSTLSQAERDFLDRMSVR